jgi:hypothetical protein
MDGVCGVQGNVIDDVKPTYAVQDGTWGPPKEAEKENLDDIFGKKPVSVRNVRCVLLILRNSGGLRALACVDVLQCQTRPCSSETLQQRGGGKRVPRKGRLSHSAVLRRLQVVEDAAGRTDEGGLAGAGAGVRGGPRDRGAAGCS